MYMGPGYNGVSAGLMELVSAEVMVAVPNWHCMYHVVTLPAEVDVVVTAAHVD